MKPLRKESKETLFFGREILIHGQIVFFCEKEIFSNIESKSLNSSSICLHL